jgi:hypothetical protein
MDLERMLHMEIKLRLTGTKPMLHHNGRLANPLDRYTRELKALTGKRTKTDEDLIAIMRAEARGACWETDDGLLGVPTAAVWRCIYDAAKAYKRGEDVKRALSFADVTEPLLVAGSEVTCDEFLTPNNIDYRPVKVQGKKTMRARPIAREWETVHSLGLLEDVMNPRDLAPILERAGRLVGLGDWRPTYGTFEATVI